MIVAVDTGGTKTLVAVFDTDGEIVAERKFPTPADVHDYIVHLKSVIDELTTEHTITCLSVALPGTIVNGHMVQAGNLGWHDTDIKALLANHYDSTIIVENDANLAGLAEVRALKKIPQRCLYLTVSTGIGTGIITNGVIDPNYATSEGGHVILEHEGTMERWEAFGSGKAILAKYGKLASEINDTAIWDEIALNIARGLMVHCPILRPDIVVIGGGVGTHFSKFSDRLMTILNDKMKESYVPVVIEAIHPEKAVIYGCYYHALDASFA